MQNPKELILNYLKNWLDRENISSEFEVSLVENFTFGDFSTNIAMVAYKKIPHPIRQAQGKQVQYDKEKENSSRLRSNSNPRELAESIVSFLKESADINEMFSKIEVAGPGFINFFLSQNYLQKTLSEVVQRGKEYGVSNNKSNQKIMVEFAHPNTHKEFHIGHLRNIILGESICRLLESQGTDVSRVNYQGDVGMHVAKALHGVKQLAVNIDETEKLSDFDKAAILGKAYAAGSKSFEENEEAKKEITTINKQIYARDAEVIPLWETTRRWSLEYFEDIYKRMGSAFNRLFFESEVYRSGKEIVLSHIKDGIFEESSGAVIFPGEKHGLHNRVFVTSEGNPTYEGKEMGLGPLEYEEFHFDKALHVVGPEQASYFQVVFKALELVNPELVGKEKHIKYGFVQLKEGKMSSRMGNIIRGEWLLDEAVSKVKEAFPEVEGDIAEKIGVGAVKYSMLKFSISSDIHFSFEESISLEGNSGPYLQYSYVRTQSVLRKSGVRSQESESKLQTSISNLQSEENELLRFLIQFPYILEQAAEDFAPNLLCNYLFELSQKFNLFYQKCNILNPVIANRQQAEKQSIEDVKSFRLNLTKATGTVLKNGLNILGIETVERM